MVHPDFLEEQLTQRQLNEWLAWHQLSPIGERRADTRIAILAAHLRAAWIENDPMEPEDFRPHFGIYACERDLPIEETEDEAVMRQRREASQFA